MNPVLKNADVTVLAAIMVRINGRTGEAWVSFDRLAQDAGFERRSVVRSVKVLCDAHYLVRVSGNRVTANTYSMGSTPRQHVASILSPRDTPAPTRARGRDGKLREVGTGRCARRGGTLHGVGTEVPPQLGNNYSEKEQGVLNSVSGFEEFWSHYPKRDRKHAAMKVWRSLGLERETAAIVRDLIARKADAAQWLRTTQFAPLPENYLEQRRWEDGWRPADPKERLRGESIVDHMQRRAMAEQSRGADEQILEGDFTRIEHVETTRQATAKASTESQRNAIDQETRRWLSDELSRLKRTHDLGRMTDEAFRCSVAEARAKAGIQAPVHDDRTLEGEWNSISNPQR